MKKSAIKGRHAFSPPYKVSIDFKGSKDMTRQEMAAECDINRIMARYLRSGNVDHFKKWGGQYMDVPPLDYQEAMNIQLTAQAMFDDLPAHVRKKFDNKPAEFLEFVQNPKNADELITLGLRKKPVEPAKPSNPPAT